jgi:hypothetical protein
MMLDLHPDELPIDRFLVSPTDAFFFLALSTLF